MSGTTHYTATTRRADGTKLTVPMVMMGHLDTRKRSEVVEAIIVIEGEIAVTFARVMVATDRPANEVLLDVGVLKSLHSLASDLYRAYWDSI